MLHYITLGFVTITLLFVTSIVAQADEYGERFYNHTPAGMAEYTVPSSEFPDIAMDDIASELQDIMPTAGEKEGGDEVSEQAESQAEETQDQPNLSVEQ
ncbi:MAG: hypothetical protein KAJ40_01080 [Alphaproteobacteria bacterium]|nr:hypothetical protein [Alphaproteobacteria bacterium]